MAQLESFPCFLVTKDDAGQVHGDLATCQLDELAPGEVLVDVEWSALNYKDALSATGHPGVTRKFPHVPGIDAAGRVLASNAADVAAGNQVLVTGHDMGQNTWGGFAARLRVPAAWTLPLPDGLSSRQAMIYGTAGLTAAQCVEALRHNHVLPASGEVVVTGASGGVGSLAVGILARLGYQVVAVTGKSSAHEMLARLGAARVVGRDEVTDTSDKPLLKPRWAGAVDTVGGLTLATLLRGVNYGGCVAACGLVGGVDVPLTVYPFILRGVTLAGIDSVECPLAARQRIWQNLAHDWRPAALDSIATETDLADLPHQIRRILAGEVLGRVLVRPG